MRFEVAYRDGRLPQTCFPEGYDQSDLQEISTLTDRWAKFMNISTGQVVDCAEFAAQMERATVFMCMPKCDHIFDKWEDVIEDGRACGGTMVCSKCGTTALQESMWG